MFSEAKTLIIDPGSSEMRIGYAGETIPSITQENLIPYPSVLKDPLVNLSPNQQSGKSKIIQKNFDSFVHPEFIKFFSTVPREEGTSLIIVDNSKM